jgi:hypothetical protein
MYCGNVGKRRKKAKEVQAVIGKGAFKPSNMSKRILVVDDETDINTTIRQRSKGTGQGSQNMLSHSWRVAV